MRKFLISLAAACAAILAAPSAAVAQDDITEYLEGYRGLFEERLRSDPNGFTLCVNAKSFLAGFEHALAEQIGLALLADVTVIDLHPLTPIQALDASFPYEMAALYVLMAEQCDGVMGFILSPGLPGWLHITSPYAEFGHVFAVTEEGYDTFADIPLDRPIGSTSGDNGDLRLLTYLQALPEDRRWKRFPYFDTAILFERLVDGTLGGAVIWAPSLHRATGGDLGAHGISLVPPLFSVQPTQIGIAVRAHDKYMRTMLDTAIEELAGLGVLDDLIAQFQLGP